MKRALVCGAGGFIGGHLVKKLKREGYWGRGVEIKEHGFARTQADEFLLLDPCEAHNCWRALNLGPSPATLGRHSEFIPSEAEGPDEESRPDLRQMVRQAHQGPQGRHSTTPHRTTRRLMTPHRIRRRSMRFTSWRPIWAGWVLSTRPSATLCGTAR